MHPKGNIVALSTQPYKGSRDFYPEDKRFQKYLFKQMRTAVEKFGYEEYDAPIIEPLELYQAKTGQEIVNEQTYTFTDRGGREVAIRPEMTPSVSRMVAARRQELAYPLRWYSLPNLWRYERPQRGRLREHWQLNADIFGVPDLSAEHEVILVADQIMKSFGAKRNMYSIKLNSRKLMNAVFVDYLGLGDVQTVTLAKLIDRMHKMDRAAFVAEVDALFTPSQREQGQSDKLLDLLKVTSLDELPEEVKAYPATEELNRLMKLLKDSNVTNAVFDISVMRGFDYYTSIVFEVFDTHPENSRSMFGGGRYDGLVGLFGVDPVPTVGFGMGDVTLANFLEAHELLPKLKTETDMYVVMVGDVHDKAQNVLAELRQMGLKLAVDLSGKKLGDQIKTAVKKQINYILIVGDRELDEDHYTIKNLATGEEEKHSLQRIVSLVKDYRKA
jgi:histidyl-tRNA synthetase